MRARVGVRVAVPARVHVHVRMHVRVRKGMRVRVRMCVRISSPASASAPTMERRRWPRPARSPSPPSALGGEGVGSGRRSKRKTAVYAPARGRCVRESGCVRVFERECARMCVFWVGYSSAV